MSNKTKLHICEALAIVFTLVLGLSLFVLQKEQQEEINWKMVAGTSESTTIKI